MDQVGTYSLRQQIKRKRGRFIEAAPLAVGERAVEPAGWKSKPPGVFHGGLEEKAKVLGGFSIVD